MNNITTGKAIWIARHGNRADIVDPTWRLRAARPHDPPLSPDDVEQARKLGRRLKGERNLLLNLESMSDQELEELQTEFQSLCPQAQQRKQRPTATPPPNP